MSIKSAPVLLMVLLVWLLSWQGVKAAVIHDLYDAKVAVDNQSEQAQNNAFKLALEQVLFKVRGKEDLLADAKVKRALTKATRFVRSYSYDKEDSQLYLAVSFDPQRVEEVVRSAGFPVWGIRRPDSLIWLTIMTVDDSAKKIASENDYPEMYQALHARSKQRGITLTFPLWDLMDRQALDAFDIWGGFSSRVSAASERYASTSVLSARIYPDQQQVPKRDQNNPSIDISANTAWVADWTMIEGGGLLSGQVSGDSHQAVAQELVDALADQLAAKYAINLDQVDRTDAKIQIVINNLDSLVSYSQALSSLESMSVVNSATLIKQQGPQATFELDLLGDIKDLSNALSLHRRIRPVDNHLGQAKSALEFLWVK